MSYQVLARKWRPAKFEQVVGQSHVLHALTNALTQQRLHHAYLFSGTRGVGKTSLARLFAKGLNCEQGVSAQPCGKCSSCIEIAQGRFVDLIEVDAASRTKVDDTRELLDNVQYRPSRGRYKVYLIDEVHMLSRSSFNALLKTLEEPPEHVKFLLATTDPQKLPITVLSRCLQFNLKSIAHEEIVAQLIHILSQESLAFEEQALTLIAKSANGSMRDALSLTDQAIAFGAGQVMLSQVQTMLGSIDEHHVIRLLKTLMSGDIAQLMQVTYEVLSFGADADEVLRSLLELLHQITLTQFAPAAAQLSLNSEQILLFANELNAEQVQLYYQILLTGRKDLIHAPDPKSGLEMALLRAVTFVPEAPITRWKSGDTPVDSQDKSAVERASLTSVSPHQSNDAVKNADYLDSQEMSQESNKAALNEEESQSADLASLSLSEQSIVDKTSTKAPVKDERLVLPVVENDEEVPVELQAEMALIMSQAQSQGANIEPIELDAIVASASPLDEALPLNEEVKELIHTQETMVSDVVAQTIPPLQDSPSPPTQSLSDEQTFEPLLGDDILDAVLAARDSLLASTHDDGDKETAKKSPVVKPKSHRQTEVALDLNDTQDNLTLNHESASMTQEESQDRPPWESVPAAEVEGRTAEILSSKVAKRPENLASSTQPTLIQQEHHKQPNSRFNEDKPAVNRALSTAKTPLSGDNRDLLWYKFMASLEVGGRVRQLAVNSVCLQFSHMIQLQLKPDQKHLCADIAISQLEAAITHSIGQTVQLSVEVGVDLTRETPLEVRKRFHQELLRDAEQMLVQDENIQWLMHNMQAQIQLDTLAYAPPLLADKSNDIELLTLDNFDKLIVA
ncbi:DNA polymerase III subunit gamma/tau [uncultured Shewanella sp.]|uniref:DNA polymerase III subunit gamma/tau n=1 Tax=uncultured Shewanella sp. TaxID=173975 RepID=UPI0026073E90|nr:DNA polymerase III subunit gamma/tau [uncultured Shewanella sp.]